MKLDYGDWVRVLTLPGKPKGLVTRRCRRNNQLLWVEVDGRKGALQFREKDLEKIPDETG